MIVRPRPLLTVWHDWAVLVLLLALLALLVVLARRSRYTFVVPTLAGRRLADKQPEMERMQLPYTLRRVHSNRPEGEILEQQPRAGVIYKGDMARQMQEKGVLLVVSKGKEIVAMPGGLKGRSRGEVARQLASFGFEIVYQNQPDQNRPEGTVIHVEPEPGAKIARGGEGYKGGRVKISVSAGIKPGQLLLEPQSRGVYRLRYKPEAGKRHRLLLHWVDLVNGKVAARNGDGEEFTWQGGREFRRDLRFRGYGWIALTDDGQVADIEVNERGQKSPVNGKIAPVNRANVPWYTP